MGKVLQMQKNIALVISEEKYTEHMMINVTQFIVCTNVTPITNRITWADLIWVSISQPLTKIPQIVRIPQTCTNTSILAPKRIIHFNLTFPPLPDCH